MLDEVLEKPFLDARARSAGQGAGDDDVRALPDTRKSGWRSRQGRSRRWRSHGTGGRSYWSGADEGGTVRRRQAGYSGGCGEGREIAAGLASDEFLTRWEQKGRDAMRRVGGTDERTVRD